MNNMTAIRISATLVCNIFLLLLPGIQPAVAQDAAGKVVFAQGTPTAIDPAGTQRGLSRGTEVFSGDHIVTDTGRVQLSMVDGAFISVQPDSEYEIETYNYSGTPDGSEIANYRLVKGGVRAVTGLIGRQNPEAYKVNTAVATIGIRGTGHNTRICAGDCGSRRDGLYHRTWEGITFVVNDVDSQDVPTGRGVFVADIDSDIEMLDQPPAILAVETSRERQVEEQEESEEQTRVVSVGEQRDETGGQRIVTAARGSSTVLTNNGILGVLPEFNAAGDADIFGFQFDSSLFFRDSDDSPIAIFGNELDDSGQPGVTLATIDVAAVRGGNNATRVNRAETLLSQASPRLLSELEENPASVAEFFLNGEIGFGRWTDGRVLVVHDAASTDDNEIIELAGFQSVHFLFGTQPPALPSNSSAFYKFIDGTSSTSASGNTFGEDGVSGGNIDVFFGNSVAFLQMDVGHDNVEYSVSGPLALVGNTLSDVVNGDPSVDASGGACAPCRTFIDAGFLGPALDGFPKYIGLEYDIQAADVIMGVAAFGLASSQQPQPVPTLPSTVLTDSVFIAVSPDLSVSDQVNVVAGSSASLFVDAGKLYGALFTEDDGGGPIRVLATVNPNRVLGGDDPTSVTEAAALLNTADSTVVDSFNAGTPAAITDSSFNPGTGFGWGRWTSGHVLSTDNGGTDDEVLVSNQSIHFIYGQDPGPIPTTGTANYSYFTGGTSSTSSSGATIGQGVTSGAITVDFDPVGSSSINMNVDHAGVLYNVAGPLGVDTVENSISDIGVSATTAATGSICNPCTTYIDGGFTGPSDSGVPRYIGIEYDIQDTDVVSGVAGFGNAAQF